MGRDDSDSCNDSDPPKLFLLRGSNNENAIQSNTNRKAAASFEGAYPLEHDITKLSGEGRSGKMQICLSLCVDCIMAPREPRDSADCIAGASAASPSIPQVTNTQLLPDHRKTIYISAGSDTFVSKQLHAMVRSRLDAESVPPSSAESATKSILEEELIEFVPNSLPTLLQNTENERIGLTAIDNLSFLFRFGDALSSSTHTLDRTGNLFSLSSN